MGVDEPTNQLNDERPKIKLGNEDTAYRVVHIRLPLYNPKEKQTKKRKYTLCNDKNAVGVAVVFVFAVFVTSKGVCQVTLPDRPDLTPIGITWEMDDAKRTRTA